MRVSLRPEVLLGRGENPDYPCAFLAALQREVPREARRGQAGLERLQLSGKLLS